MNLTIELDHVCDYSTERYVLEYAGRKDHIVFLKYKDPIDIIGLQGRGGSTRGTSNSGILVDLKRVKFLLNSIEELN